MQPVQLPSQRLTGSVDVMILVTGGTGLIGGDSLLGRRKSATKATALVHALELDTAVRRT